MPPPLGTGNLAGNQVVDSLIGEHRNLAVEHGDVDMLSLSAGTSPAQRSERRNSTVHTCNQVDDRWTSPDWRSTRLSGYAHRSRKSLHNHVVSRPARVGSVLTEAGDRAKYNPRIQPSQYL